MSGGGKLVTKEKGKKRARVLFWSAECKYSVIIDRVAEHDWKQVDDEKQQGKVNIFWIDVATIHEHFRSIQPWQCINHFPGMPNVARKNKMGQNLNKLLKVFPKEYSFYPRTWILPGELADFRNQFDSNGNSIGGKIYIIKPDAGCQGRGIYLTKTWEKVPLNENVVAQLYIKKPLLVDGYKFDLRIYVFVTSVKPLRVYLFHDGLVRMCTEEYVKPTSKNIDNSCMHLTNYAVNKHNDNFAQPDEEGDSGHKRSLQWFMDWIRAERGDTKADWLWKRMGVIIMRTLLSIIPILSREYDQHFKSFSGVPVDIRKLASAPNGYSAPTDGSATSRGGRLLTRAGGIRAGRDRSVSVERDASPDPEKESGNGTNNSNSGKSADNTGSFNNAADSCNNEQQGQSQQQGEQQNESEGEDSKDTGPKFRGSRCFEVLGYDIMVDSNLNPWVIEVNHLPSFGTDSPMDQDIKQRLMEQVFSVLPVMADDQQAYAAHHKAESERRLVAQHRAAQAAQKEREAKEQVAREKANRARPPLRPKEPKREAKVDGATSGAEATTKTIETPRGPPDTGNASPNAVPSSTAVDSTQNGSEDEDSDMFDEEVTPERLLEIKAILFDIYTKYSQEKLNKIDRLLAKYVSHEEEFLRFVMNKYGVDPALYKPQLKSRSQGSTRSASPAADAGQLGSGGEESPSPGREERPSTAGGGIAHSSIDGRSAGHEQDSSGGNDTADTAAAVVEGLGVMQIDTGTASSGSLTARGGGPKTDSGSGSGNRNQIRETSKRASRSMSPPRSTHTSAGAANSNRRPAAAWKTSSEEEDAKFWAEVMAMVVPKDDDEWLLFETARLTEFTRLYPPPTTEAPAPSAPGAGSGAQRTAAATAAELEVEVQGEDEGEEEEEEHGNNGTGAAGGTAATGGNSSGKEALSAANSLKSKDKEKDKGKAATYEEIIFQAFLQDRRQTMRMHQPLHMQRKAVTDDSVGDKSFLPPLDSARSSGFSSISTTGKGAVGWKAPPKPVRETVVRQPTQGQAEAAKRLSQGLSVTNAHQAPSRQRYIAQNQLNAPGAIASTGYSVVLDPHEYHQQMQNGGFASGMQQPGSAGNGNGAGSLGPTGPGNGAMSSTAALGAPYLPVYGGVYPTFGAEAKPEGAWPSTKASRLLEESRLNRMRLEAAKAHSAGVVRQQVFYFDPNYRDQIVSGGSVDGLTLIPPVAGGMAQAGGSASTGGLLGADTSESHGTELDAGRQHLPPANRFGVPMNAGSNKYTGTGAGAGPGTGLATGSVLPSGGSMKVRAAPAVQQARHASTGNIGTVVQAAAQAHSAGNSTQSQEELLRQLFPSWF